MMRPIATAAAFLLLGLSAPAAVGQSTGQSSGISPPAAASPSDGSSKGNSSSGTTEADVRHALETRGYSQLSLRADGDGWVGTATTPAGERVRLRIDRHGTIEETQ